MNIEKLCTIQDNVERIRRICLSTLKENAHKNKEETPKELVPYQAILDRVRELEDDIYELTM